MAAKEVIFIGGSRDGDFADCFGSMLVAWHEDNYEQSNGYLNGRLMLLHKDFINQYKDK